MTLLGNAIFPGPGRSKRDNCGGTPNDDGEPLVSILSWRSFGLRRIKSRVFKLSRLTG